MAIKQWLGTDAGNEGDLSVAANWSPSGVPANGDDVYFVAGVQSVTAGFAALSAVNLASLNFGPGWSGSFGSEANPVQTGNITLMVMSSGGNMHVISPAIISRLEILRGFGGDRLLDVRGGAAVTITDMLITGDVQGIITVAGGARVDDVRLSGVRDACVLDLGAGITSFDLVEADSGRIILGTSPAELRLRGTAHAELLPGSGTLAFAQIAGSAVLDHRSGANITEIETWEQGILDARNNPTAGVSTIATLRLYGGQFRRPALGNVAVTAQIGKGSSHGVGATS